MKTLPELQQLLVTGQSLSMQSSMDRRMPDKKAEASVIAKSLPMWWIRKEVI